MCKASPWVHQRLAFAFVVISSVPIDQWHSLKSLESGTVLLEAKDCINLRVILMHLIDNYEEKTNFVIDAIKKLLAELDQSLDEYGLSRSKRMFEY